MQPRHEKSAARFVWHQVDAPLSLLSRTSGALWAAVPLLLIAGLTTLLLLDGLAAYACLALRDMFEASQLANTTNVRSTAEVAEEINYLMMGRLLVLLFAPSLLLAAAGFVVALVRQHKVLGFVAVATFASSLVIAEVTFGDGIVAVFLVSLRWLRNMMA